MESYPDAQYVVSFSETQPSPWAVELLDSVPCVRLENSTETDLVRVVVTEEGEGKTMLVPEDYIESIENI
jgi:hypothetical protein